MIFDGFFDILWAFMGKAMQVGKNCLIALFLIVLSHAFWVKTVSAETEKKPEENVSPLCKSLYDKLFYKNKRIKPEYNTYLPPEDGFLALIEPAKIKGKDKKASYTVLPKKEAQTAPVAPTQMAPPSTATPLNADVIFGMINQLRQQAGLPGFEKDDNLCSLAQARGSELYNEIFITHTMHSGLYNRNLPYWITENAIYMHSEQQAVNWWLNSPVHRSAIYGNAKYSCAACVGNSCSELFTSYQPKYPQQAS